MSEPRQERPLRIRSRPWHTDDPRRVVGKGHPIGDFLHAYDWTVLERENGFIRIEVPMPEHVRNPRGSLFGGFTPAYVDFASLHAFRAGRPEAAQFGLTTAHLRVDYYHPILGDRFIIEGRVLHRTGRTGHVETRFFDTEGKMLALAVATLIELNPPQDQVRED